MDLSVYWLVFFGWYILFMCFPFCKIIPFQDSKKFTVQGKMERDQLVRSVLTGVPVTAAAASVTKESPAVISSQAAVTPRPPLTERARRTPKMCRFRGSSQRASARPVSLFVDGPSSKAAGGASGLVRSSSLKRIPNSETATPVSPASVEPSSDMDLSPQLESALGRLSA